jgi:hypothetical protein
MFHLAILTGAFGKSGVEYGKNVDFMRLTHDHAGDNKTERPQKISLLL